MTHDRFRITMVILLKLAIFPSPEWYFSKPFFYKNKDAVVMT